MSQCQSDKNFLDSWGYRKQTSHRSVATKRVFTVGQTIRGVECHSVAITAAVAVPFGALAWIGGLPVPWLLCALFGTAAFTLGGVSLVMPSPLKTFAHACIGLILGASIEPETFARAAQWPLTLLVLPVGMILVTTATALYYIRVAGFDRLTATAASLTGGWRCCATHG
jgi:uncharacterized membrane protein AbrB (regulator of aidB expression)